MRRKKQQTDIPDNFHGQSKLECHFFIFAVSMIQLLKVPGIIVCSMSITATSASIGFLAATLEPHLRQFDLSPVLLGE